MLEEIKGRIRLIPMLKVSSLLLSSLSFSYLLFLGLGATLAPMLPESRALLRFFFCTIMN